MRVAADHDVHVFPVQVGSRGHCSVEDAQAALDLYKLVEGEWEQEVQNKLRGDDDAQQEPTFASSNHYMQDEYWPDDLIADSQWKVEQAGRGGKGQLV